MNVVNFADGDSTRNNMKTLREDEEEAGLRLIAIHDEMQRELALSIILFRLSERIGAPIGVML